MKNVVQETKRMPYLDALRGIAALMVTIGHCIMINADDYRSAHRSFLSALSSFPDIAYYLIQKCLAGRAAVMMFFVLSGFVLAYSLLKNRMNYESFVIRRFFRIYPVFLFVILFSYFAHLIIGAPHEVVSTWFKETVNPDLSVKALIKNLVMWDTPGSNSLDNVMWTLVHELRISIIFPIILWSVIKYRWKAISAYLALSLVCTWWHLRTTGFIVEGYNAYTFAKTFLNTAFFIIYFAAGAFMALERERVASFIKSTPTVIKGLLFIFCAYSFFKTDADVHTYNSTGIDFLRGISSLGLIALALGNIRFQALLNHIIPIWLGRVSYSLYLIHIPILYIVDETFGNRWSVLVITIVVTSISLLLAEILYRSIELPGIKIGKSFSK